MLMTDVQLYLAIGLPVFAFLLNIALGVIQTNSLQARISSLETSTNARFTSSESTMNARFSSLESSMNARFSSLESSMNARFTSLETRFDALTDKVVDIDNRLTRVEERLLHS
jgi:chaperonin cofactor prefoldin